MSGPTSPRFGLNAELYRRLRPDYPPMVFERLASAVGPARRLVADLGAGSGQAHPQLLAIFERVIAVEPDADMAALIPADPRVEVRGGPAESAVFDEPLDAVVAATAFHWMDARRVCEMAARSLRAGGVFMPFGYGPFRVVAPRAAQALAEAEYELWLPHADPRLVNWRPYAELIADSGVAAQVEPFEHGFERAFSAEDAAGLLRTTSYATAYAREQGEGYAEDFTRRMVEAAAGEPVTVRFDLNAAVARF